MVNMCMGLDHQINRIRINTAAGKLGFGQIIRPANQHLSEFIKVVFSAGSPKVLRIFAGKPAVNQHIFTRTRFDQIATNADDTAIAMHLKKTVIQNGKGHRMPRQQRRYSQIRIPQSA